MQNESLVKVRFLIFKYGKLLLSKGSGDKWNLIEGDISSNTNIQHAVDSIILEKCAWETSNIRLFELNMASEEVLENKTLEIVFIVDAIKKIPEAGINKLNLKWFSLNDLPKPQFLDPKHKDIIYAFAELVHQGKTLDLEHLPPVINTKLLQKTSLLQLGN